MWEGWVDFRKREYIECVNLDIIEVEEKELVVC